MKILNFTNTIGAGVMKGAMLTFMLLLGVVVSSSAQCTMVCSGHLVTNVDPVTCESTITFEDLIPNPCFPDGYTVELLTLNNQSIAENNASVTVTEVGRYIYKVSHEINGADVSCWGYITFEDKSGPVKELQMDQEPDLLVCGELSEDPSGVDDLATEFVSCVVKEEFGEEALEPWFDVLDVEDYTDCSGVKEVYSFTEKFEYCKDVIPADVEEATEDNPHNGWEPSHVYKRSWFAADVTGRLSDTCSQYVVVLRPKARRIMIDNYITAECGDDDAEVLAQTYPYFRDLRNNPGDINTCPSSSRRKIRISPESHYCKYSVSVHYDNKIPLCYTDGSKVYKVNAHWTVMDWCNTEIITGNGSDMDLFDEFTNTVEVYDTQDPVAVGSSTFTTQTSLFDCTGTIVVGPQVFTDCVGVASVTTTAEYIVNAHDPHNLRLIEVSSETNGITLTDIPLNTLINITYQATDSCGNDEGFAYNEVYLDDDRAPVCIANDELNVSMVRLNATNPDSVGTRVYAEDLDDTSKDNCFPLILEVRRSDQAAASNDADTLWAEYVEFSKADLTIDGCSGSYKVELRVTEDRSKNGQSLRGLSSTCWGTVIIEDKNPPLISVGEDKVFLCTEPIADFDVLDIKGCYAGVDMRIDTIFASECDYEVKLITRKTWKPYLSKHDAKIYTDSISQEITIKNVHDTKFTFPIDVALDCSEADIPVPTAIDDIIDEEGCANWLMEVEDREFASNDPDACRKILRRYTFVNWCTWDPSNTELAVVARPADGVWSPEQQVVLHYQDANLNGVNDIDDLNDGDIYNVEVSEPGFRVDGAWVQIDNGDNVQGQRVYNHTEDIRGNDVTSLDGYTYGYFSYTQVIKVQDDETPVAAEPIIKQTCDPLNTNCELPTLVEITLGGSDNCSDLTYELHLQPFQVGAYVKDTYGILVGNVSRGYYPEGTHNFIYSVSDACGNVASDTIAVTVQGECKKPTPVCYATFTATMENGTVQIWASDIESGSSSDNCSAYGDLRFGLELLTDVNDDSIINAADASAIAPVDTVVTLTCANVGVSAVALWVIDEAGNEQFCIAPVTVLDNALVCANQEARVSGAIVNEENEEIDAVTVSVSGSGMNPFAQIFDGFFNFQAVPMNDAVTVTAEKDLGYMNGVSTSDLVLLQRHILGMNELNSPYKLIAADANGDDKVDTRDLLHISRLILGINEEFPNNSSWRFVSKDHTFANPTSPWGFPESTTFSDMSEDVEADFIGVKIGDISGNASPNRLLGDDSDTPIRTVTIATDNLVLDAGQNTEIVFSADQMNNVAGYQFTLALTEGVEYNGLSFGSESGLTEANFGLAKLDENMITVSWSSSEAMNIAEGTELFTLSVVVAETAMVQNAVSINSAFTAAEAYDNDVNTLDIKLNVRAEGKVFELYQNIPNPVSNETIIGFNLPEAGKASLRIMDVSGKVLRSIEGSYNQGYNQITLDRSDLGAAGVLYYQLDANHSTASKKMIIID